MSKKSEINGKWIFGSGSLKAHYVCSGQTKSVCNRDLTKHDEPASENSHVGYECKNCLAKLKGC
jgi:hypothetical protein